MTIRNRWFGIFALVLALAAVFFSLVRPIPQSYRYLDFADQRELLGIPNFRDVVSNLPFFVFGLLGVSVVFDRRTSFADPADRWPYFVFFAMIFFTGAGSAYFHLDVNVERLFWDRMPISLAFMALVAGVIGDRSRPGVGGRVMAPLLFLGAISVFVWSITEAAGHGDLRLYAFVQYGSMVALLPILCFIPSRYTGVGGFWLALGGYGVAKAFEIWDRPIYGFTSAISGHTLKHLAAGLSTYFVLVMLRTRKPLGNHINL